jgi:DNA-binding PadR family transcriptional regulator
MSTEASTLYKLIVLYMLDKVNFPLTNERISDFILGMDYTDYFTLQQVISELSETGLVYMTTIRNTSHYEITTQGKETLGLFENKISSSIKEEIQKFLQENRYELRNEVNTTADYYKSTIDEYIIRCQVKEGNTNLIELNIAVPTAKQAERMCANWKENSQNIYAYIMKTLQ